MPSYSMRTPSGTDGVADSCTWSELLLGSGSEVKMGSGISSGMGFKMGLGSEYAVRSG